MRTLTEFREWLAKAPPGMSIPVDAVRELLDRLDDVPTAAPPVLVATEPTPASWREKLWTVPPETRIGRVELLEAVGRPASWLYRQTAESASGRGGRERIPHRKLDGELVFVVGEIRAWIRETEELIEVGPLDRQSHQLAS